MQYSVRYIVISSVNLVTLLVFQIAEAGQSDCKSQRLYEESDLTQVYVESCLKLFNNCMDTGIDNLDSSDHETYRACNNLVLPLDHRYRGPCPNILSEYENLNLSTADYVITQARLRSEFTRPEMPPPGNTYKYRQTKKNLRTLLSIDPDNVSAIINLQLLLDQKTEIVESLDLEIRLQELDPSCSYRWPLRASTLSQLTDEIVSNSIRGNGPGSELSKDELDSLIFRAWRSLESMYDYVIRNSGNVRELSYAIQSVDSPFLLTSKETQDLLRTLIGVNLEDYLSVRSTFITSNLKMKYKPNSGFDRGHVLGMICNKYAFELGLIDYCLEMIEYFLSYDLRSLNSIQLDVFNATQILLQEVTRDCKEPKMLVLHYYEGLMHSSSCFQDRMQVIDTGIAELFNRDFDKESNQRAKILIAYLNLDSQTVQNFSDALRMNFESIIHVLLLAKRLQRRGFHDDAVELLNIALDTAREEDLSEVVFGHPWHRGMGFPERNEIGSKGSFNEVAAILIDVQAMLEHRIPYSFYESTPLHIEMDR